MPDEKTYNCLIYAENWSWSLINPANNSPIKIFNIPTDLASEEYLRLNWIEIYCQKFINPYTTILTGDDGDTLASKGQITSNANIVVNYIKINGVKSVSGNDWTLPANNKVILQPTNTTISRYKTWANVTTSPHRFTFSDTKVVLDGKSKTATCIINISGLGTSNTNGVTFRLPVSELSSSEQKAANALGVSRVFGRASVSVLTDYPDSINLINVPTGGIWITNSTGKAKNNNIFATKSTSFKISVSPEGAEISDVKFTGNTYESCKFANSTNTVTVTATNSTINNSSHNVTISMKGNGSSRVTKSFKVNFYTKPSVAFSIRTLKINIKNFASANYVVSSFNVGKGGIDDLTIGDTYYALRYSLPNGTLTAWNNSIQHIPNSNNNIPISRYLGINSNVSNYFKIANDGVQHILTYRYYNPKVQNVNASNNYNTDVTCYFTFYAKPSEKAQFSYDWLTTGNNNNTSTEPSVIMPGFNGAPVPGNLSYSNKSVTGGYCRAIRISYYKQNGSLLYSEIKYTTDQADGSSLLSGKIITKSSNPSSTWMKLRSLLDDDYSTEMITVRADLAFYFTDAKTTLYNGCNHTWTAKLWLVTEEDFNIQRLFPVVSESAPATPMMLTDVERFGYILSAVTVNNASLLDVDFGVTVGGKAFTQNSHSSYFSSNTAVTNMVVDVGKIVADNNLHLAQCAVLPYLTIFTGKSYEQKIQFSNNWSEPNATINTLESTMWYRPNIEKGEYATYFDVDRFQQFINKYTPLNSNLVFSPIVKEKRGDIINVKFWRDIEEKLDVYSKNMQNWASSVTNMVVIWAFPEFKHKQGEYITNNNLYQNYWDLLHMFSGYDSFATHDYIKNNGYTHNDLSAYTHDDITNKRGI